MSSIAEKLFHQAFRYPSDYQCEEYKAGVLASLKKSFGEVEEIKFDSYTHQSAQRFAFLKGVEYGNEIYRNYAQDNPHGLSVPAPSIEAIKGGWKFRPPNQYTLSVLLDCKLWFATPESLNDPFDSTASLPIIYENVVKEILEEGGRIEGGIDAPSQYVGYTQRNGWKHLIFSLSKILDNSLMWSHYADKHTGVALGFDFDNDPGMNKIGVKSVEYDRSVAEIFREVIMNHNQMMRNIANQYIQREEPIKLSQKHSENIQKIKSLSYTVKGKEWSYEKEVRCVMRVEGELGQAVSYSPVSLKYVVIGCMCEVGYRETLLNILRTEQFSHVKVFDAKADKNKKILRYYPVTP